MNHETTGDCTTKDHKEHEESNESDLCALGGDSLYLYLYLYLRLAPGRRIFEIVPLKQSDQKAGELGTKDQMTTFFTFTSTAESSSRFQVLSSRNDPETENLEPGTRN
jgi:hypothetical protein